MRIIHLAQDEKFIKYAFNTFNDFQEIRNDFFIFSDESSLKHISFDCTHYNFDKIKDNTFVKHLNNSDLLVIHFLDTRFLKLLENKKLQTKILWIGWGGDYYQFIDTLPEFNLFKSKTLKYLSRNNIFSWLKNKVKFFKKLDRSRTLKIINNKVDFFAPVLFEDYELVLHNYSNFKPKYINWNYGPLEDIVKENNVQIIRRDILIGNSATTTNNHLDVLESIKDLSLDNRKIIIPLNYGDLRYANFISEYANKKFGKKIICLKKFMSLERYLETTSSCGNVIMGHIRQQGLGNILNFLFSGSKVFFYKESVTYKFFTRLGVKVFLIENLIQNKELLDYEFNEKDLEKQRLLLKKIWGEERIRFNTSKLLKELGNTSIF